MKAIVIPDTSCLIALDKIDLLHLLRDLFQEVVITPEVAGEFGDHLPGWFVVQKVKNKRIQQDFERSLDQGEASSIALTLEIKNAILIVDEKKGRQVAENQQIYFIGTLRLLLFAKQNGLIHSLKPLVNKLVKRNFRVDKEVVSKILKEANE